MYMVYIVLDKAGLLVEDIPVSDPRFPVNMQLHVPIRECIHVTMAIYSTCATDRRYTCTCKTSTFTDRKYISLYHVQ